MRLDKRKVSPKKLKQNSMEIFSAERSNFFSRRNFMRKKSQRSQEIKGE